MITLTAILILVAAGTAVAEEASVAVINTKKVYGAHPSFKEATQKLREKQKELNKELKGLSKDKAAAKKQKMQIELQKYQQELIKKAAQEANSDISSMAEELGFDVVISSDGIIAGEEELSAEDITEELIAEVKEKYNLG